MSKTFTRTASQKIQDEVRNKSLHEDIAWREHKRRVSTMRELLDAQQEAMDQFKGE